MQRLVAWLAIVAAVATLALSGDVSYAQSQRQHPCAVKQNPCVAKQNPCAAKQHPCAAKKNELWGCRTGGALRRACSLPFASAGGCCSHVWHATHRVLAPTYPCLAKRAGTGGVG
jgi:hypothetical protein